jgi:hypothetical protein
MHKLFTTTLLLWLAAAPGAGAADSSPPLQTVEVKGTLQRLVPYKSPYYDMAHEVEAASVGRVVLAIQLSSPVAGERLDDIRLQLESDDEAIPVDIDKNGLFVVPMVERMARRDDARFSVNKRKGTLLATGVLLPAVPRDGWTVGGVRQITADMRAAIRALAPWYMKPLAAIKAKGHGVSVCAAGAGEALRVVKDGELVATLPLASMARDHARHAVFCHTFSGKEPYEDSSRIVLPEQAQVLLL